MSYRRLLMVPFNTAADCGNCVPPTIEDMVSELTVVKVWFERVKKYRS